MWQEITHTISGPGQVDARFASGLRIRTDHPPEELRAGRAPEPWSLFLASIGSCIASFVDGYCREEGLPTGGIRILQRQAFDRPDGTIGEIRFDIELPADFPDEHVRGILESAETCTVKRVIEGCPKLRIHASQTSSVPS